MRLLFVKHALSWPRSSGHDVHTFHMMKACGDLGHDIFLATVVPPEPPAVAGASIAEHIRLSAPIASPAGDVPGTYLQRRLRSYWGVEEHWIHALMQAAARLRPHAVIVSGLNVLPYLPAMRGTVRVWYAADEMVLHHLSLLRAAPSTWREQIGQMALMGVYERAHRRAIDRAWVVSEDDQRAMHRFAGVATADLLPNGVDAVYFAPGRETPPERTAAFWGRLDFGPNVQALEWFCRRVWPIVRSTVADARFTIMGFQPTDQVRRLAEMPGIRLEANLRDLRQTARSHAVAVLPFISGGGIKNKLLEAAAMGMPIACTPVATHGLRGTPPLAVGRTPEALAAAITTLWADPARRAELGAAARSWVVDQHSWSRTATDAMAILESAAR